MASTYTRVSEGVYERHGRFYAPKSVRGRKEWGEGYLTVDAAVEARGRRKRQLEVARHGDETVDSFVERWVRDYGHGRSESTNQHNQERIRKFGTDFEGRTLRSITRAEARAWLLGSKGSPWDGAPNRGRLGAVRAMFSDAVRDGLADENPFVQLRLQQPRGRRDIVALTEEELQRLVAMCGQVWGEFGSGVFGPMVATAAWTGVRPGELYAVRDTDIDYATDRLSVRRQWSARLRKYTAPKTQAANRRVPLLPPAVAALKQVSPRPVDRTAPFFQTPRGVPFTQRTLHYYWGPVRTAFWAKLPADRQEAIPRDFDFYELRHFFGSRLAAMGVSPFDIARAMGHDDGGETAMRFYVHTDEEEAGDRILARFRNELVTGGSGTSSAQADTG